MSGGDSKFIAFTLTGRWRQFNLYLTDFEGMACPRSFLLLLRDAHIDRGQEASKSAKYKLLPTYLDGFVGYALENRTFS